MKRPWYEIAYEQKEYLHNRTLRLKSIELNENDHRHCELCWDRFSNLAEDLHRGYYDEGSGSWICENCYNELKDLFNWTVDSV